MIKPKITLFEGINIIENVHTVINDEDMRKAYWNSFFNTIYNIPEENIRKEIFKSEKEL